MPLTDVSNEELKDAYNKPGATLQSLADTFGCTRQRVQQRLKKIGVNRRPQGATRLHRVRVYVDRQRFTPDDQTQMVVLYVQEGKSLQKIADVFDTTPMTIMRYLKLAGIERRSRGRKEKVAN